MLSKKTSIGLVIIFIVAALFSGCKKANVVDTKPIKDPRTYTWTADTLWFPGSYQTLMTRIWGSSPKDVYVVGHCSSDNNGVMWHFDGNKWENVLLSTGIHADDWGAIGGLYSIYGFSSTDIYAAGSRIVGYNPNPPPTFTDSNLIIHYDGSTWKRVNTYNGSIVADLYGITSSDVWAGGAKNTLYHYNGSSWIKDSVHVTVPTDYYFSIGSISTYNSNYYMVGANINDNTGSTTTYFFKRLNNNWAIQDSFFNADFQFGLRLNQSKLADLYSYGGGGIYKYSSASWSNFFQTSLPISSMWGAGDNNIFAVGTRGRVYHYNGSDWKQIEQLNDPQVDYYAVWTDGTEAFVVGHIYDGVYMKTIVWHGK